MEIHASYDQHIEVHKYYAGTIFGVVILALALEAVLPVYFRSAAILELPLLITIYFGLSRRNPSSGLLLGMAIGLAAGQPWAYTLWNVWNRQNGGRLRGILVRFTDRRGPSYQPVPSDFRLLSSSQRRARPD